MKDQIKQICNPSMTRMEAWKATQAEGLNISWPDFKRMAGQLKLKFREVK